MAAMKYDNDFDYPSPLMSCWLDSRFLYGTDQIRRLPHQDMVWITLIQVPAG
jgi:hypothetical protein